MRVQAGLKVLPIGPGLEIRSLRTQKDLLRMIAREKEKGMTCYRSLRCLAGRRFELGKRIEEKVAHDSDPYCYTPFIRIKIRAV